MRPSDSRLAAGVGETEKVFFVPINECALTLFLDMMGASKQWRVSDRPSVLFALTLEEYVVAESTTLFSICL
jgi:hypothetical protein